MKKRQAIFCSLFAVILALAFASCAEPEPSPDDNSGTTGPGNGNGQLPTVTSVTLSPSTVAVPVGQTQQFSAAVAGTNNPAQTVTWTVEGGGSGTGISTSGLLSIAATETAQILTVRATSTIDASKSGTATVTVGVPINWVVNNLTTWADAHYGITNGGDGKIHIITVSGNVAIPPTAIFTNTFGSVKDITVIMQGTGTITISGDGYLLLIGEGQTVSVKDLTLQGRDNSVSVIDVWTGSTFRMEGSAKVTGNIARSSDAGGVRVRGGTFNMRDEAVISGNSVSNSSLNGNAYGGGVLLDGGSFTMRDNARVDGNTANISLSGNSACGGGVYVNRGTFTMEGGSISNNTVSGGSYGNARGGGVYVTADGFFNMHNGTISGNTANGNEYAWGGGVSGNFTMYNGTISDNTVSAVNTSSSGFVEVRGGGVDGNLIMHGGNISGNNVTAGRTWGNNSDVYAYGGGVYGQLTMNYGTISGNTVSASNNVNANRAYVDGGGVYTVWDFTKTGGTIYSNYSEVGLRNIAIGGRGHAVFFSRLGASDSWRNATAGPNDSSARLDFWLDEIDITYSVVPKGLPTTSFIFTFSEDPGNLLASHITLSDNVSKGSASLTGSGTTRTLSPVNVSGNSIVTVSILSMYKVETGSKNIIPVTPTVTTPVPSASTVMLSWEPVSLANGYRIYRSTSASGTYALISTTSFASYADIRLPTSTTFYYRISAYNNAGESAQSDITSATTLLNNSDAIAISSSSIVVEWPRDPDADIIMLLGGLAVTVSPVPGSLGIRYTVDWSNNLIDWHRADTKEWPPLPIYGTPSSSEVDHYFVDTGLLPNTLYYYKVAGELYYQLPLIPNIIIEKIPIVTVSARTWSQ